MAVIFTLRSLRLLSSRSSFFVIISKMNQLLNSQLYVNLFIIFISIFNSIYISRWIWMKSLSSWEGGGRTLIYFESHIFLFQYGKSKFFFCLQFSLVCLRSIIFWKFPFFSAYCSLIVVCIRDENCEGRVAILHLDSVEGEHPKESLVDNVKR